MTDVVFKLKQASVIIKKVKKALGAGGFQPANVPELGKLARGLLLTDLAQMMNTDDDVDDLADILSDHLEDLSSAQVRLNLHFINYQI